MQADVFVSMFASVCAHLERLMKITLEHWVVCSALDCNHVFCTFAGPQLFIVTLLGL